MSFIKNIWNSFPLIIQEIITTFSISRVLYTFFGVIVLRLFAAMPRQDLRVWPFPSQLWLKMWAVWDSGWYLNIAQTGYKLLGPLSSGAVMNIGFFPLYPVCIKFFALVFFFGNYFTSALIVSNVSFILGLYFLYKLLKLDYSEEISRKTIYFMFLLPLSFVFSGIFTESLFFLFSVTTLYFSRKNNWLTAGVSGFLLTLTKPLGILIFIPLLFIYWNQNKEQKISLTKHMKIISSLCLIPLGIGSFFYYLYKLTGNFFAYSIIQQHALHHHFSNPFVFIYQSIVHADLSHQINAWYIVIVLALLCIGYKKLPLSYWLYSICFMLFAPLTGEVIDSFRYSIVLFPLALLLAQLSQTSWKKELIVPILVFTQALLFVCWLNAFWFVS